MRFIGSPFRLGLRGICLYTLLQSTTWYVYTRRRVEVVEQVTCPGAVPRYMGV
jgi:hypothetical protein